MYEMTLVLISTTVLGIISYEFTMMIRGNEFGENASNFF